MGSVAVTRTPKKHMILFVKITPILLLEAGKNHKWENCYCHKCKRNMWGHGFTSRYFSEIEKATFVKRYRCPTCSTVVTTRPETYWKFLRSSLGLIFQTLIQKISENFWPPGVSRQRGGHWLRRFSELARMENQNDLLTFVQICQSKNLFPFPRLKSSVSVN